VADNLLDGIISARNGATGTERNNLAGARTDLLVNAAAGDRHRAATAASAIDRGLTTSAVTDDWDGQLRPQGAGYDIALDALFIPQLGVNRD